MVAESAVSREEALAALVKSKGNVHTLDDLGLEDPQEPELLKLKAHHKLIFVVELCEAKRPGVSLKGSHEKYEEQFQRLESGVTAELSGTEGGVVEVIRWEPGMPMVPSSSSIPQPPQPTGMGAAGGGRSRPQSAGAARPCISRPQSAASTSHNARLRAQLGLHSGEPPAAPRIGAFEVSYKLLNTTSGQQYGPVEVFSKIATQTWPGDLTLIINRVQQQLQGFLQRDLGAGFIYQHVQGEAKAKAEAKPKLRSAEELPDPDPPAPASPPTAAAGGGDADVAMKTA